MHAYALRQPIMWLICDKKKESLPPSLLLHVDQGDYFGTLATVLNFVREGITDDFQNKAMTKKQSIETLEGMRDDLVYLQNNFDIAKKE